MRRASLACIQIAVGCALCCTALHAQEFPSRTIKIIVPAPANSLPDVTARAVGNYLSKAFGQPVALENQFGVAGILGMQAAARAEPDGHTLVLATSYTLGMAPSVYVQKIAYDPIKSFSTITQIAGTPVTHVVSRSIRTPTCPDFVNHARMNPGAMTFASSGSGTPPHFNAELFKSRASINLTHVPYRGLPAAIGSVVQGD